MERRLKKYLIITAASVVGFIVCAILHNVVYGLFIYWFGPDFWERIGIPDEPFFFLLAVIICPVLFLIGLVGSLVFAISEIKNRSVAKRS
ncbi:MAG: hypothetical protein JSW66_10200 [Phycisphaerales bacterium]|nr:MAG: hypothetical protein JSW66_10200 [Phycisphaerales bacterium]